MPVTRSIVAAVLRSPLHRVLSGSTDLIRYTGRRTGRTITIPTQYALSGSDLLILVARADTKTWWRNFRMERDLDVLVRGVWQPSIGRAMLGREEPDLVAPLLDAYLARFPKAARVLGAGTRDDQVRRVVLVRCEPKVPVAGRRVAPSASTTGT
jgi:hypothetical protein